MGSVKNTHAKFAETWRIPVRKNFEKHFGEPTDIHGLKCLGITNGPLFKEVTSIEEAIQRIPPPIFQRTVAN